MDSNVLGSMLLLFIETYFPGGLVEYNKQGGLACLSPFDEDATFVYHPRIPKAFVKTINDFSGFKIEIVKDLNSPDAYKQIDSIEKVLRMRYNIPGFLYSRNPIIVTIFISEPCLNSDDIQEIIDMISNQVPGLTRGCLVIGESKYPLISTSISKVSMIPERGMITQDDISNLKITLANADLDVNDFINML